MIVLRLALQSLASRAATALLTVLAIAVSVMLLVGVEKVRTGARQSFADTISGTDLILGARSGSVQLLLYSVFRIGDATANVTWKSYQDIAQRPEVAWAVPLSLGDGHRGFRVLGTSPAYFVHYRYRNRRELAFAAGRPFADLFDVVLGADVARSLGYELGDSIVIAHGLGRVAFVEHSEMPFRVTGILAKTGTPVDRTLHVGLAAIEAIHADWQNGMPTAGATRTADQVRGLDLTPKAITAALIGLESRLATFKLQRAINGYAEEPLTAIIPGAALQELWQLVGLAETALSVISAMVVATAILGLMTSILTSLNERRREMAILRSVGARPTTVLGLLVTEAVVLTFVGVAVGVALLYLALWALQPLVDRLYGLYIPVTLPGLSEIAALFAIVVIGALAGLVPAWRAYRLSLADGMTPRI